MLNQNTDWSECVDYIEERRVDPWNYKLYTQKEFFDYYGRYSEWEFQHPALVLKRKKINDMVFRYKNVLKTKNINHLLDKMIETFL